MAQSKKTKKANKSSTPKIHSNLHCFAVGTGFLICIILPGINRADDEKYQPSPVNSTSTRLQDNSGNHNYVTSAMDYQARVLYRLWLSNVSYPEVKSEKKKQKELLELIEKVRSVKLEKKTVESEELVSSEPGETDEPNKPHFEKKTAEKTVKEKTRPIYTESKISELTLKKLKEFLEGTEKIENPFQLAEILYRSGQISAAAGLYQHALKQNENIGTLCSEDEAWIIFQIANCLRNENPELADKMYKKLIQQYADSPWVDLAKARDKLLNWYGKEKPQNLVKNEALQTITKKYDIGVSK